MGMRVAHAACVRCLGAIGAGSVGGGLLAWGRGRIADRAAVSVKAGGWEPGTVGVVGHGGGFWIG